MPTQLDATISFDSRFGVINYAVVSRFQTRLADLIHECGVQPEEFAAYPVGHVLNEPPHFLPADAETRHAAECRLRVC